MLRETSIDGQDDLSNEQNSSSLTSTNDDLKELCFLLDEERYKMHQLAEQWKHFGTSTIHKLESQIFDYQERLSDLEQRQILLLKENETLKSLVDQMMATSINNSNLTDKLPQKHVSTQANIDKDECPTNITTDDSLQQQISLQNMFDAIKTAKVYESIQNMSEDERSEKTVLKDFCNLIWKYLEERSKPKSSCLL